MPQEEQRREPLRQKQEGKGDPQRDRPRVGRRLFLPTRSRRLTLPLSNSGPVSYRFWREGRADNSGPHRVI